MQVTLLDCTGAGTPNPARHAANVLVFTKQTRLTMVPSLMDQVKAMSDEQIQEELSYIARTVPSSWEFVDYTFLITGVTRAFTHQFVRTRTASYAQQTMRVLNVEGWTYGTGPTIASDPELNSRYRDTMAVIADAYDSLIEGGAAIEDARGVLPTNIHTNIVAKMNLRTLSELICKRSSPRTQGEYREVLEAMKQEVCAVHPWAVLFLRRDFDRVAAELDEAIRSSALDSASKLAMHKLVDQMRGTA